MRAALASGGYRGFGWLIRFACCTLPPTRMGAVGAAAFGLGGGGGGGGAAGKPTDYAAEHATIDATEDAAGIAVDEPADGEALLRRSS